MEYSQKEQSRMLVAALDIAMKAHGNQFDRGKKPYLLHPLHVMSQVESFLAKIVALLHDVVEDSEYKIEDIRAACFPEEVCEAVLAITKVKGETRMDAAKRAKQNELARTVKIADVNHNMDLSRLGKVSEKDLARLEEYKQVLEFLLS